MLQQHHTVYIVDDDDDVRDSLRALLESCNFTVRDFGSAGDFLMRAASASGLREGDVITSVNNRRVIGLDQFVAEAGKVVERLNLDVIRNGEKLLLQIRMSQTKAG